MSLQDIFQPISPDEIRERVDAIQAGYQLVAVTTVWTWPHDALVIPGKKFPPLWLRSKACYCEGGWRINTSLLGFAQRSNTDIGKV